mmetsp:Transcript_20259/g.68633  ORF Transcript_20259/g.68633 Transcript_20259/m.68633 type:complete len:216 (-) Transcript_20259:817-1464(-)
MTASTVSSAISRYVVHLPPVTNVTPVFGFVDMMWSRDTGAPSEAFGSLAKGRQPHHAEVTSDLRSSNSVERYFWASFSSHSISISGGRGEEVGTPGRSVVPMRTLPSQGMRKRKRPSEVLMSSMPNSGGRKYPGNTMCVPAAPLTAGTNFAAAPVAAAPVSEDPSNSTVRSSSVNGPPAKTTCFASTRTSCLPTASQTIAPTASSPLKTKDFISV